VTASVAEEHSIAIPDIAGVAAVIAGTIMVVMGQRRGA
jgi:hypothetical protein